ncbi:hypothetical protein H7S74_13285 [Priestia aryabhattai]|uniref:hypothetical protein n=1 Tax=Priestia aryabhattai TaxID=412384 RepID=UPI001EB0C7F0|nr:hypothetical protein [Priestia aryabhattai]MBY0091421.1 hypothetical protein [Priestia aryabhattai]MBY0102324.1 hypothetical protein [Priestia aryabhattai]
MKKVKKREVGEQGKGFRLQRLRAIQLLLGEMRKSDKVYVYAATEHIDDLYIKSVEQESVNEYTEGDKDYASKKAFSFMSEEVRNTLVGFIDCWLQNKNSNLIFGFYTNVAIGRENNTATIKKMGLSLPDRPIIELLKEKNYDYQNLFSCIKTIIIDYYKSEYDNDEELGFVSVIDSIPDKLWIEFFNKIEWKFDQEDDKELEETLIEEIKNCKFYNISIEGKEKYILGALEREFEMKQSLPDILAKQVTHSDVKTIFLELANHQFKRNDPAWEDWEDLDQPVDKRNINMKITAVCEDYNPKKLGLIARKVGSVKKELQKLDYKERGSYQYRIYEACVEKLIDLVVTQPVDPAILDTWFDELLASSKLHLDDKSQDYTYPFKSIDTLKNTIYELFDSCFLAFDEEGDMN